MDNSRENLAAAIQDLKIAWSEFLLASGISDAAFKTAKKISELLGGNKMQVDKPISLNTPGLSASPNKSRGILPLSYREWSEDKYKRLGQRRFDVMCHNHARDMFKGVKRIANEHKRQAAKSLYDQYRKKLREATSGGEIGELGPVIQGRSLGKSTDAPEQ